MARQVVTDEFAEHGAKTTETLTRFGGTRARKAAFWQSPRGLVDLAAMLAGISAAYWLLGAVEMACASLWWIAVVVVIRSDLESFIIPDEASIAIAVLGLVHALTLPISQGWPVRVAVDASGAAVFGGIIAFAVFWVVALIYRYRTGNEGLGFGDVKLAGASAIWLESRYQVIALEIAALAAVASVLLLRRGRERRGSAIPFGAFLAPSAWLAFVAGPVLNGLLEKYA